MSLYFLITTNSDKRFAYIFSFIPQQLSEASTIIISTFQMKKLRHKAGKWLVQGYMVQEVSESGF